MADWDQDGPDLQHNIERLLLGFADQADSRASPTVSATRDWHRALMHGLVVPERKYVGSFRGAPDLEGVEVRVGRAFGVRSDLVSGHLDRFERELQRRVKELDDRIEPDRSPTVAEQAEVIELCAWVHAEWVRIHPFANGNGRIARLWANFLAMRCGMPPFVRVRPRPDGGYGRAGALAMQGDWRPTISVFRKMYNGFAIPPSGPL